ncbi:SIMPL domain-containing protein [Litoribacter ruber]|uniref:SIMPL domain-containing protein n=1 Tax=Litoribacter ruber TaxID=702568 RepID=A0AAP2G0I0_9BACT|nr:MULTISPECIES: SIMPL domain-containing protein [Litoribacter]MBS9522889.1 SIMPL domain-containing protein [Litoribacter alkaliphilus]MBT0812397.1 SIMPL domain-containing protein [Litoribacter ruber]
MRAAILSLLFLVALSAPIMAQDNLIEVEGQSEIKIKPDQALLSVNLQLKAMQASQASQALNKKTNTIIKNLEKAKIEDMEVFTSNYFVNINRIYQRGSSKDSGYVASQTLNIKVNELEQSLFKVMEVLGEYEELNYSVSFQLTDDLRKSKEEELLKLALEDAQRRANTIASAMNLGELMVKKVQYKSQENFARPMMRMAMDASMESAKTSPVLLPEEQTLTDKVLVTFGFKQ